MPQAIDGFLDQVAHVLSAINSFVWGPPLLILLVGTHLFLTIRTGFIQKHLWAALKLTFRRDATSQGDVSHFGALCAALAATIGTGNIIGVGTAIYAGGPGAVFWMWITGVLGMATKYGEAVLAIKYRTVNAQGNMAGGPMYAIERGLGQKWLGVLFALFAAIAAFGIGNLTQSHSISDQIVNLAGPSAGDGTWVRFVVGLSLAAIAASVLFGGVKRIAWVSSIMVPFMAIFYIVGCLVILGIHFDRLPGTIWLILESAFTGYGAMSGGVFGYFVAEAIRYGVARGLFSNESGMGSAPMLAAAARSPTPVHQGLVSCTGTFWDTVVVCLMTGLVLVSSGEWNPAVHAGPRPDGGDLTSLAFGQVHILGPIILTVSLFFFVLSTILGWSYYGEKAVEYLGGLRLIPAYRLAWVIVAFLGAVIPETSIVWDFSDIANGLMTIPNLIALILLSNVIVRETREHIPDVYQELATREKD
jgi:AGCS family alanine or glycine:cation symporter